jgi:hypothetical protein
MPTKTNSWVNHIKKFATSHNTSYACALSMPACRNSYRVSKKQPTQAQKDEQKSIRDQARTILRKK